jgi:hypothetical protein
MSDTDEGAEEFDPESRRLCPDDTCTGVVGPDGKCKVCGKASPDGPPPAETPEPAAKVETAAEQQPPEPASTDETEADAEADAEDETEDDAEDDAAHDVAAEDEAEPGADDFDPDSRRLCPDDACIGVIGPDGKCKVCGKESPDGPPPTQGAAPKPGAKPAEKKPARPLPTGKGAAKGFDPNDRLLCSDGCCTGLIGPDGKCKVCGKPYAG